LREKFSSLYWYLFFSPVARKPLQIVPTFAASHSTLSCLVVTRVAMEGSGQPHAAAGGDRGDAQEQSIVEGLNNIGTACLAIHTHSMMASTQTAAICKLFKDLKAQKTKLKETADKDKVENDRLKREVAALQQSLQNQEKDREREQRLDARKARLDQQGAELNEQLRDIMDKTNDLQTREAKLVADQKSAMEGLNIKEKIMQDVEKSLHDKEQNLKKLQDDAEQRIRSLSENCRALDSFHTNILIEQEQVKRAKQEVEDLRRQVEDRASTLQSQENNLKRHEQTLLERERQARDMQPSTDTAAEIEKLKQALEREQGLCQRLQASFSEEVNKNSKLQKELKEMERRAVKKKKPAADADDAKRTIERLQTEATANAATISASQGQIALLNNTIVNLGRTIEQRNDTEVRLRNDIADKEKIILSLENSMAQKKQECLALSDSNRVAANKVAKLEEQVRALSTCSSELEAYRKGIEAQNEQAVNDRRELEADRGRFKRDEEAAAKFLGLDVATFAELYLVSQKVASAKGGALTFPTQKQAGIRAQVTRAVQAGKEAMTRLMESALDDAARLAVEVKDLKANIAVSDPRLRTADAGDVQVSPDAALASTCTSAPSKVAVPDPRLGTADAGDVQVPPDAALASTCTSAPSKVAVFERPYMYQRACSSATHQPSFRGNEHPCDDAMSMLPNLIVCCDGVGEGGFDSGELARLFTSALTYKMRAVLKACQDGHSQASLDFGETVFASADQVLSSPEYKKLEQRSHRKAASTLLAATVNSTELGVEIEYICIGDTQMAIMVENADTGVWECIDLTRPGFFTSEVVNYRHNVPLQLGAYRDIRTIMGSHGGIHQKLVVPRKGDATPQVIVVAGSDGVWDNFHGYGPQLDESGKRLLLEQEFNEAKRSGQERVMDTAAVARRLRDIVLGNLDSSGRECHRKKDDVSLVVCAVGSVASSELVTKPTAFDYLFQTSNVQAQPFRDGLQLTPFTDMQNIRRTLQPSLELVPDPELYGFKTNARLVGFRDKPCHFGDACKNRKLCMFAHEGEMRCKCFLWNGFCSIPGCKLVHDTPNKRDVSDAFQRFQSRKQLVRSCSQTQTGKRQWTDEEHQDSSKRSRA